MRARGIGTFALLMVIGVVVAVEFGSTSGAMAVLVIGGGILAALWHLHGNTRS